MVKGYYLRRTWRGTKPPPIPAECAGIRAVGGSGGWGVKSDKTPPNTPSPPFSADSAVRPARALARSDATPINKKLTYYYNSGIAGGVPRHLSVSDEESTGVEMKTYSVTKSAARAAQRRRGRDGRGSSPIRRRAGVLFLISLESGLHKSMNKLRVAACALPRTPRLAQLASTTPPIDRPRAARRIFFQFFFPAPRTRVIGRPKSPITKSAAAARKPRRGSRQCTGGSGFPSGWRW